MVYSAFWFSLLKSMYDSCLKAQFLELCWRQSWLSETITWHGLKTLIAQYTNLLFALYSMHFISRKSWLLQWYVIVRITSKQNWWQLSSSLFLGRQHWQLSLLQLERLQLLLASSKTDEADSVLFLVPETRARSGLKWIVEITKN